MLMDRVKVWGWFKGGLEGGYWMGGFLASKSLEGGFIIEKQDFVSCRVPDWRISLTEPKDLKVSPNIPEDALWKYSSK